MANMKEVDSLATKLEGKMVVSVDSVDWEEAGLNLKFAILIRSSMGRNIHKKSMEVFLPKVWKIKQAAIFMKVERDLLLVNFNSEEDQLAVLNGGPWSFEGSVLIMQKWIAGMMEEDFDNTKMNIWVQLRQLPFEFRSYAKRIAKFAGDIVNLEDQEDVKGTKFGSQFVRVIIQIDTTKPILSGLFLERPSWKPIWISFKYERLSPFYYNCGLLNHDTKACKVFVPESAKMYGNWIRTEVTEVHSIPWSEGVVEKGDFMVVSMPEKMSNLPESERLAEQVQKCEKIHVVSVEMKGCELNGNLTASNIHLSKNTFGSTDSLGFDIKFPTEITKATGNIRESLAFREKCGKSVLKVAIRKHEEIEGGEVEKCKRVKESSLSTKRKKVKFRNIQGTEETEEGNGGNLNSIQIDKEDSALMEIISATAVVQPRRTQ